MLVGYYFLSFTWGFLMSFIGLFVILGSCVITKTKPKRFGLCYYNRIGEWWGGAEWGAGFICDKTCKKSTFAHEHGHGLQNIILGPFMPFVVCIPSAVRYWLYEFNDKNKKNMYLMLFSVISILFFFIPMLIGIFCNCIPVIIVFGVLLFYAVILVVWLLFIEAPKYKDGKEPLYDSIWFEGCATRWGTKFMEKYFPEDIYDK